MKAVVSVLIALTVATATAAWSISTWDWFGIDELPLFLAWSSPYAAVLYPVTRYSSRLSLTWPLLGRYSVAIVGGLGYGFLYSLVFSRLLGFWFFTISIPVVKCWMVGAVAAFVYSASPQPRYWPSSAGLILAMTVIISTALDYLATPPDDLMVYLEPGSTVADSRYLWDELLTKPNPVNGRGRSLIDGINGLGAADKDSGQRGIRITFYQSTTEERRTEIIEMLLASGYVRECAYVPGVTEADVKEAFAEN